MVDSPEKQKKNAAFLIACAIMMVVVILIAFWIWITTQDSGLQDSGFIPSKVKVTEPLQIQTVSLSAGDHTVGLKADGTAVAAGDNYHGQCNVEAWQDIVAISAGCAHTVGLKADGTVVAVGYNGSGRCDVDSWILATP